jgi:hypothetical protein
MLNLLTAICLTWLSGWLIVWLSPGSEVGALLVYISSVALPLLAVASLVRFAARRLVGRGGAGFPYAGRGG